MVLPGCVPVVHERISATGHGHLKRLVHLMALLAIFTPKPMAAQTCNPERIYRIILEGIVWPVRNSLSQCDWKRADLLYEPSPKNYGNLPSIHFSPREALQYRLCKNPDPCILSEAEYGALYQPAWASAFILLTVNHKANFNILPALLKRLQTLDNSHKSSILPSPVKHFCFSFSH